MIVEQSPNFRNMPLTLLFAILLCENNGLWIELATQVPLSPRSASRIDHSTFSPAALTRAAHFGASVAMKAANSCVRICSATQA
jgi:hypothetical protein